LQDDRKRTRNCNPWRSAKGQALSDWCREALLFQANQTKERSSDVESIVLEEVLALRTVLTTILFHISHGRPVKEGDMRALLEKGRRVEATPGRRVACPIQKRMEGTNDGLDIRGVELDSESELGQAHGASNRDCCQC
jgi:hypothetical protein